MKVKVFNNLIRIDLKKSDTKGTCSINGVNVRTTNGFVFVKFMNDTSKTYNFELDNMTLYIDAKKHTAIKERGFTWKKLVEWFK